MSLWDVTSRDAAFWLRVIGESLAELPEAHAECIWNTSAGDCSYSELAPFLVRENTGESDDVPEQLSHQCSASLVNISSNGKLGEVINLIKNDHREFSQLGARFLDISRQCYTPVNPFTAATCSMFTRDAAGEIFKTCYNDYILAQQSLANDLSIIEKALFASSFLYYATGAFLFV